MRRLENYHVISRPMRGLKTAYNGTHRHTHTGGHCDSMTDPAQRAQSVKNSNHPLKIEQTRRPLQM